MNGLPVTATASISPAAARAASSSRVFAYSSRLAAPSVFGRVWSRPLSSVMSARVLPEGRGMSRTYECVTTSSSAREGQQGVEIDGRVVGHPQAFFAFLSKFGFSQIIVPPWPRPTHMLVMP